MARGGRGIPKRKMARGGDMRHFGPIDPIGRSHPRNAVNAKCVSIIGQIECEDMGCNWNYSENSCH